jgi:inorganic pyrophosphatase
VMLLLDEGETDWKIIVIDVKDPLAEKLNDINDVEQHMPGLLDATVEWFRFYKVPDGKPVNEVAFGGQFKDMRYDYVTPIILLDYLLIILLQVLP